MNLLEELLARAQQPQSPDVQSLITDPAASQKMSLIERLTGQKMRRTSPFPDVPSALAPAQAPPMAPQAGLLAPGIGGLGNMDAATTAAPTSPIDPNYADPKTSPTAFDTPEQRKLNALVNPNAENAPRPPMPQPGPHREADGTVSPVPSTPQPTDLTSRQRGPAAEEERADAPAQQAPAGPQMAQPSLWDNVGAFGNKIMNGLHDHSATLLALGAGFAGAPNIGQGISRASQFAIPAIQQDLKNSTALQNQSQTYRALINAGVPAQQALAAIGNTDLQKRLLDSYIGDRKREIKEVKSKDFMGNETTKLYSINPYDTNDVKEVTPSEAAVHTANGVGGGGTGANFFFAPGVTAQNFDHSKTGDEYLNQYSPEVQAGVKNYLAGNNVPTGRQQLAQAIKFAATKYGNDIGMPADDAAIVQRKEWARSLGDTKSGVGLQARGLHQGLEHFTKLSDSLVKAHLSGGFGLEPLARGINMAKGITTSQSDINRTIGVEGQALAGEMGNLFSKNGGGVHERQAVKDAISDVYASGKSAAGALEGIVELMDGGVRTLEGRRNDLFPTGNAPKGSNFMGPEQEAQLAHIKDNIARLRGEMPEAAPAGKKAAAVAAPAPGRYVWDPATGKMQPLQ